jgi:E3 ubiquitin-protein ligase BRE1
MEMQQRLAFVEHELKEARGTIHTLQDQHATAYSTCMEELKVNLNLTLINLVLTAAQSDHSQEVLGLKELLARRDSDIGRLREARDQFNAELTERRSRDNLKIASQNELKSLTASQSVRRNH